MFVLSLLLACGPKKEIENNSLSEHSAQQVVPQAELRADLAEDSTSPPSETKGIQSVQLLGAIPLSSELEGVEPDVFFRMRRLVVDSGGVVAAHEHQARPGIAYIVSGEINEFREGKAAVRESGA